MPRAFVASAAVLALAAAGCGGGDNNTTVPPVRLTVDQPVDSALTRDDTIEVHGHVSPATADVKVEGRRARVSGGRFSANVSLEPGTNIIDVLAGQDGTRPAMQALRVQREVDVRVPTLVNATPGDAEDALSALGLQADIKQSGGILDFLLPDEARVCQTDPPADTLVPPGTTVTVVVAKSC